MNFCGPTITGRSCTDQVHLEQIMKELTEETERWDLEPQLGSLWWSNTNADEIKADMKVKTPTYPVETELHSSSVHLQPSWQNTTKFGSKDVPCLLKCRRMVEHVCSVVCFGFLSWSWRRTGSWTRKKGLEMKALRRSFRFKRRNEETRIGHCTRTGRAARTIYGMDVWAKTECSIAILASCLSVEEYCVVEEYTSFEHVGGPRLGHDRVRMGGNRKRDGHE